MDKKLIAKKVADHVEKNRDGMVEFLRQVVSVPSIWGDVPQLARIADVLHAKLAAGELGEKTGKGFYSHPDPEFLRPGWLTGEKAD